MLSNAVQDNWVRPIVSLRQFVDGESGKENENDVCQLQYARAIDGGELCTISTVIRIIQT